MDRLRGVDPDLAQVGHMPVGVLLADRAPFGVFVVFLMPEIVEGVNGRDDREVVGRGRVGDRPLEGAGIPRVHPGDLAVALGRPEVVDEHHQADGDDEGPDRDDPVPGLEAGVVAPGPPDHSLQAQPVHRGESHVETDEPEPEVDLADAVVHHPTCELGEPVIETTEDSQDGAAEQDVVEVGDDVIGIGLLPVRGNDRVGDARETADGEHRDEPDREQHRSREFYSSEPHGPQPVEDLHSGGNRDRHRGDPESRLGDGGDAGGEHVVSPHPEAEEGDGGTGENHGRVTEQRLAAEHRQDLRHDPHRRQDQDVDLRMAEQPEQVLPEDRVAAGAWHRRRACRIVGRTSP